MHIICYAYRQTTKHSFCAAKRSSSYLAFLFKKCLEITVTSIDSAAMFGRSVWGEEGQGGGEM